MLGLSSTARQMASLFLVFFMICCFLIGSEAQSLERGVRTAKAKFIRFGRATGGQKFIRFGRSSWDYDSSELPENFELEEPEYVPVVRTFKRAGQKFIRFG
uniref:Uncharacterized protein n=1 Tax=Panagrolaimus sp. JU765 TaxID=591449 RepID=A0AC34Q0P7_9BILA